MLLGKATILALIIVTADGSQSVIPQPDGIVFGTVYVDGVPVGQNGDYVVLARVDGHGQPVAVYRMGDLPAAGDRYVLHLPHRLQFDGVTPDPGTPTPDTIARIYVIQNRSDEVLAGQVAVPASGKTTQLDLRVSAPDLAAERAAGGLESGGCGSGGLCGTMGMINLVWITLGLASMKLANRQRRR